MARRIGVGLLCLARALSACADGAISHEYEIKAAFLFNFTRFIEWPSESFTDPTGPIVIGVIGDDPFGAELANAVKNRRVNGRSIVARSISSAEDARATHLLFVGMTRPEDLARLMRVLSGYPVMTVGESAAFTALGGTITFVVQDNKVRFQINAESAEQVHVRISAQLEKLATTVHRASQAREGGCCVTSRSGGS